MSLFSLLPLFLIALTFYSLCYQVYLLIKIKLCTTFTVRI